MAVALTQNIAADARRQFSMADVIAGVSVALVLLPQSLAYAEIAGVPPAVGLAAAALPPLLAAFFASSPYLQTGPVALTSLLTFGALQGMAPTGSADYVKLAALLALVVGVTRLVLGLLRGGIVAYAMTEATVLGFTTGAAILIVASQLPTMFGLERGDRSVLGGAVWTLTHPDAWSAVPEILAVITIVVMIVSRRIHPLFPGVLVMVIAATAWSAATDYTGPTIGDLPGGFATLSLDLPWNDLGALVIPGIVIALVGYAEPASISRTFAALDRQEHLARTSRPSPEERSVDEPAEETVGRWDSNRELVSQGVANLASGLAGGFPVGGSFSRTALNRLAGARTVVAGGITGAVILALQPLSPLLESLPRAVLGAVVFVAVYKLIKIVEMVRLIGTSRPHAVVAWVTFVATLASAPKVERGVVVGIIVAGGVFAWEQWSSGVRSPAQMVANARASLEPQPS